MATRDTTAPKLAEVAARIQAHLQRIEKDPAHEDWCRRVILKMPTARPSGAYVAIYCRPSASGWQCGNFPVQRRISLFAAKLAARRGR